MKKNWKSRGFGITLLNLLLCGWLVPALTAEEPAPETAPGVTIELEPRDAARLQALEDTRRELEAAREEMRKLQQELRQAAEADRRRNRELLELTTKFQQQNEANRQLQLLVSGLAAETAGRPGDREGQLGEQLSREREAGKALALGAASFCELAERLLKAADQGKGPPAEFALASEELRQLSRRFISMTTPGVASRELERCRILAVDRERSFVILPVGIRQGAFNGLIYHVGKGSVKLKIVGVRPDVAAAVPITGRIDDLAPGMEAVTDEKRE